MIPSNEELIKKYEKRWKEAAERQTKIQQFYLKIKSNPKGLEKQMLIAGCSSTLANLKGEIEHCQKQIKKWQKI